MRPCFVFKNLAKEDTNATLSIYDEIGFWGVQAKDFVNSVKQVKSAEINVEINSPGGDVFAALAMYNTLKGSGKTINVKVMGVAASAASLVAMSGDKIIMPKNTFMMIHNPWLFTKGNASQLRETADTLDKIGDGIRSTYAAKTKLSDEELSEILAKDTWLTADEAFEMGFATEVVDGVEAKASFDMARADLPESVRGVFAQANDERVDAPTADVTDAPEATETPADEAPADPVADQINQMAAQAGLAEFGVVFALKARGLDEAKAMIAASREIKALCAVAKAPEAAGKAIRAGKSVEEVRGELILAMAEADADSHTDAAQPNKERSTGNNAKSQVTTSALWTSHNHGRK